MSEDKIRAFGYIAIIGGLLNTVADLFILSQPIYTEGQGLKVLEIMPVENVRIGVVLGFFALTSWLLILPSLSAGLARASAIERWLATASFTLFVVACVTFHSLYWPITVAIQATTGAESYDLIVKDLEVILVFFQSIIIVSVLVLSLDLAWTIFRKCADYPWWILLISPLVTLLTLGNLVDFIPAPYRGYAAAVTTTVLSTIFIAGLVLTRR
ncbi:MAG: DUF6796 family protein, partial [Chloroflexota bacterium]